MAVVGGLSNSSISRLKDTQAHVSAETNKVRLTEVPEIYFAGCLIGLIGLGNVFSDLCGHFEIIQCQPFSDPSLPYHVKNN